MAALPTDEDGHRVPHHADAERALIATCLTYATLLAIGLDNALFWAFVIFVLNYIPTVGSIIATVLPALFAVVQIGLTAVLIGMGRESTPLFVAAWGIGALAGAVYGFRQFLYLVIPGIAARVDH